MLFPMEFIKLLDIVVIFLVIMGVYTGYKEGFLLKVLDCFGMIVSAFLAWTIAPLFSSISIFPNNFVPFSGTKLGNSLYDLLNEIVWVALIFILLNIIIRLLHPLFSFVRHIPILASVNRVLGTLFGFIQSIIFLVMVTIVFQTPLFANGSMVVEQSYLSPFSEIVDNVFHSNKEELTKLRSLQKIMTPSTQLNDSDLEIIQKWLEDHDVEANMLLELLF